MAAKVEGRSGVRPAVAAPEVHSATSVCRGGAGRGGRVFNAIYKARIAVVVTARIQVGRFTGSREGYWSPGLTEKRLKADSLSTSQRGAGRKTTTRLLTPLAVTKEGLATTNVLAARVQMQTVTTTITALASRALITEGETLEGPSRSTDAVTAPSQMLIASRQPAIFGLAATKRRAVCTESN